LTQISDHIFSGVIYCVDNSVDCGSRIHVREAKPCATLSRLLTDPDCVQIFFNADPDTSLNEDFSVIKYLN